MKKQIIQILTLILFNTTIVVAQEIYQFKYKITHQNFIDTKHKSTSFASLIIKGDSSIYLDSKILDNINSSKLEPTIPTFKEIILKSYKQNKSMVIHKANRDQSNIAYNENILEKNEWFISDSSKTISSLATFKASINFGGRVWDAWFTPEIPASDGPYKFSGLPGLIVKIESQDKEFLFELNGIEKKEEIYLNDIIPEYKLLTKDKYKETLNYLSENQIKLAEQNGVKIQGEINVNGKLLSHNEFNIFLSQENKRINHIEKN